MSLFRAPLLAVSTSLLTFAACGGTVQQQVGTGGGTSSTSTGGASSTTSSSTSSSSTTTTSTSTSSTTSSSTSSSSTGSGATSFPFPQVIYGGGAVIAAPNVITVTFSGNTYATDLASFGASVASSSYWSSVSSDLTCGGGTACVGAGPAGTAAVSPVAIGSSYADTVGPGGSGNTLQPYLKSVIAALPSAMQPAANNLYTFYIPSSTTITLEGAQSCTSFGGYHNVMTVGSQSVVYAIVLDCGPREKLNDEQGITFAASHEIAEAASDPMVGGNSQPTGYAIDETIQSSYPWLTLELSEIGDLCVDFLGLNEDITTENGFSVQRIWSPANAATGTMDPCVPSNGEVYFNAFPTVSAVIVDVGQTKTFEIDALALGSEPTWTLAVEDATVPGQTNQYLSFSIAGGNNVNGVGVVAANSGNRYQATVKMLKDPATASGSAGWGLGLVVNYAGLNPAAATAGHYWPFIVLTSAQASAFGITMTEAVHPHLAERLARRAHSRVHPLVPRSRFLEPLLPLFR